ncbi:MAG: hypothetical protein PHW60_09345 [Kiritimatiellae bacterium]|nr:hypothetical protein [Kiritimatiellia bacterium]
MRSGANCWMMVGVMAVLLWACGSATCPGAPVTNAAAPGASAYPNTLGPYAVTAKGFILNWLIVGPFPNIGNRVDGCKGWGTDFLQAYGGEAAFMAWKDREVKTIFAESDYWLGGEAKLKWFVHASTADLIDLGKLIDYPALGITFKPIQYASAYAFCLVESPVERTVTIAIGADDDYKVWLNHALLGGQPVFGACVVDKYTHATILKKGLNPLLLKCGTDSGGWDFCVRFLDADKKPVADLRIFLPERE